MNARDYLAKHGAPLDKEEEKPQSLEEKAWARAREAAEHGPRSGTPHDYALYEPSILDIGHVFSTRGEAGAFYEFVNWRSRTDRKVAR